MSTIGRNIIYATGLPFVAAVIWFFSSIVFIIVWIIDNMMIQPYVYSDRVHAHPLEIFPVFPMAGSIGGFAGMIPALPANQVIRVFARKFKVILN